MAEKVEHQKDPNTGKPVVFLSSTDVEFDSTGIPVVLTPKFPTVKQLQAWWKVNEPRVKALVEHKDWPGLREITTQAVKEPEPRSKAQAPSASASGISLSRDEVERMMSGTVCARRCFNWNDFNRRVYNITRRWINDPPRDVTVAQFYRDSLAGFIQLPNKEKYVDELGRAKTLDDIVDIIRRIETDLVVEVASCGEEQCNQKIAQMPGMKIEDTAEYKNLQVELDNMKKGIELYRSTLDTLFNSIRHAEDVLRGTEHREGA